VLLDREPELELVAELLQRAGDCNGCVLAIEGAAGLGKTAVLREAMQLGESSGFQVLSARGSELERELAFGVAKQLLESVIASSPAARQRKLLAGAAGLSRRPLGLADADEQAPVDASAALHGLYWLLVNLSEDRPALLVVDDLQWCDSESLSWLVYLGRRLDRLPLLVCVARRAGAGVNVGATPDLFHLLLEGPATRSARLRPLGPDAVAIVVERTLGASAGHDFAGACLQLTGGNPFALLALLTAVRDEQLETTAASVARLEELGADAIASAVLVRIARLGGDAAVIAQAVAVLGAGARLHDALTLTGASETRGGIAADVLRGGGILQPSVDLEFDHPLLRAAVYRDIPAATRAHLHKRAALLLAQRSADDELIAAQLLLSEPAGDRWVVDQLLRAAGRAGAAGAPKAASTYLERAWSEPPDAELRAEVVYRLAQSETAAGSPAAEAHFEKALELAPTPQERVRVALDLALLLSHSNRPGPGAEVLGAALDALSDGDRELTLHGEAALCGIALLDLSTRGRASERLARQPSVTGGSPGERALLATRSIESVMSGESAPITARQALAALADGRLLAEVTADSQLFYLAVNALVLTDLLDEAREALDAAVLDAGRRGSLMGFVLATCWRSNARLKAGAVADAEADARASMQAAGEAGLEMLAHFALAFLLDTLLELGRSDEAQSELIQAGLTGQLPDLHHYTTLLDSRGRVRVARGEVASGLADFLQCGERQLAWGYPNPAPMAWRSNAARALDCLDGGGSRDRAVELASNELALARTFGAPRPIAAALRALAAVAGSEARCERLQEAERVVRDTGARLEHAHTLVELGAELRRGRRRSEAREMLRAGLEAAERCGASALSKLALDELQATGARPRRTQLSGVSALTASERRVAQMAAAGASNPEIAQALFVTRGTVESHLHAVYRKLDLNSRTQLAAALG
jgi:DNA-binding CsgD family transcriptional regulator